MVDEEEIIEELKNGNQENFVFLYEKYEKGVYSVLLNIVHNRDVADELLQISFMKLYKNIKLYDKSKGSFYNFVCAIAKYTAFDYLREKNKKKKKIESTVLFDDNLINFLRVDENVLSKIESKEFMAVLKKLVGELCDSQRMAITLVCERGFSYKNAARIMGITESSFRSILHRARQTLKNKIYEKYPDFAEEISSRKYVARMIIMMIVGVTALTGLVCATYMICNEFWKKDTFTISEMKTEVSYDASNMSKDEALEKMNYYLDVLGEEKASVDEIKLIKDYQLYKICWMIEREDVLLKIDSDNGDLLKYNSFLGNNILDRISLEELYIKLGLPEEYEMYMKEESANAEMIKYVKKYDDIYNFNESVTWIVNNRRLITIVALNYKYKDEQIVISKENALKIAEENGIRVDDIELCIDKINRIPHEKEGNIYEEIISCNNEEFEMLINSISIRKLWKITTGGNNIYIDALNGELMYSIR